MHANWLDIVIGGILLTSLIAALRNGVTKEIIRILTLLVGVIGGTWFYARLGAEIAPRVGNEQLASFVAFGLIVMGCLIAGGLLAWVLDRVYGFTGLRWFDRFLGAGFGLVRGLIVATALVLGVVSFAPVAGTEQAVASSVLAPWVLHGARAVSWIGPVQLREAYDAGFNRVRGVWTGGRLLDAGKRAPRP